MQHFAGDNINAVDDAGDSAVALALANGHEESRSLGHSRKGIRLLGLGLRA